MYKMTLFKNAVLSKRLMVLLASVFTTLSSQAATFYLKGQFNAPTSLNYDQLPRLSQVLTHHPLTNQAYRLGFQLQRPSAQRQQAHTKAHILQTLKQLSQQTPAAKALFQLMQSLPVTGRMRLKTSLDGIEAQPNNDPLLNAGDRLYMPAYPNTVTVVGWTGTQQLPFNSQWLLTDYLKQIRFDDAANKSFVWLIQPDGRLTHSAVGYWNRKAYTVAPGAIIYVPIQDSYVKSFHPTFNKDVAHFLTTQPLPFAKG